MAKLGAYYGLCPLIDHRSLLGISEDGENGVVIVTLGKNIAIKFKLADQKQLHSWRTKDKFSSPIIYDKQQAKYAAVFNQSFVRIWSGNEEFLDKLKKFKFDHQIYTIFSCRDKSFILFKNGVVKLLEEAVENRKVLHCEDVIEVDSDSIWEVMSAWLNGVTFIAFLIHSNGKKLIYWTKFESSGHAQKYSKIHLERENFELKGYTLHVDQSSVNLLTIWNDARIYSQELKDSDLDATGPGDLFIVNENLVCKEYVSMVSLDPNYIALYGCNSNEEGALLVIYNVQFKVTQSKVPFKLFTNGAKVWAIGENLFLPVGQNLAVVPFHLDTEQLAALVGSHKIMEFDPDAEIAIIQKIQLANWGNKHTTQNENIPAVLKPKIVDLLSQGLSENLIFQTISTDLIENQDVNVLTKAIEYFSDIPEQSLANILNFVLNLNLKVFENKKLIDFENYPTQLQPAGKATIVDLILSKSYNETLLLPHLRSILTLDQVLILLKYISFLLSENGHSLPTLNFIESEEKLIGWSCVLLDANYQKMLLTRDNKISEVLTSLKNIINDNLSCFDDLKLVNSLLAQMAKGKTLHKKLHFDNLHYTIEDFPLYK